MNAFDKWISEFNEEYPEQFEEALEIVNGDDFKVIVFKTDELGEDGDLWVIESFHDPGFWMCAEKTKQEAIKFCEDLDWEIEEITDYGE